MVRPLYPERAEPLRRAAEQWKRQLVDVSGRNPLLNFRDLRTGTLSLTPASDSDALLQGVDSLLRGRAVLLSSLFPTEEGHDDARRRVSAIHRQAQATLDEKGINTLFVASGLATWDVEARSRPNSPVVLIPITISPTDAARRDFKMEVSGDPHLNPVLAHVLREEHGVDPLGENGDPAEGVSRSFAAMETLLAELAQQWSRVRGLSIRTRIVLGNFKYANMPMVVDLDENLDSLGNNDLVAAIAGVDEARLALAGRIRDPSMDQPDSDPPESEFLVLDADASQHRAINRATRGESVVIWGPPGTGKSQTIANLIVSLNAVGKRVLFVAEKRAAIEVVVARLQRAGLGNLVMDAHGGIKSKREFAKGLAETMREVRAVPLQDYTELHQRLQETRGQLVAHTQAMHEIRKPWNISLYEVQEKLIGSPAQVSVCHAMPSAKARDLDRASVEQLMREAQEWADLRGHEISSYYPEWAECRVDTPEEARDALTLLRNLSSRALPETRTAVVGVFDEAGLTHSHTVGEWYEVLRWLKELEHFIARFDSKIFTLDHSALKAALEPARHWWKPLAVLMSGKYRAARDAVRATCLDGTNITGQDALRILEQAAQMHERWSRLAPATRTPVVPRNLESALRRLESLVQMLRKAEDTFAQQNLVGRAHPDVAQWLNRVSDQEEVAATLPRIRELRSNLVSAGFDDIISRFGGELPAEFAAESVFQSWLKAVRDEVVFGDPRVSGFTEAVQDRRQRDYIELDRQHLSVTPERVRRSVAEAAIAAMNAHETEASLVTREAAKSTRHIPVRRLFQQAPHVLTALRPCWVMSPLLVAELIPADASLFDVVIFDEASQIPPAEAIGVLGRAPQAVVAGDDRQLPPTSFFASQNVSDEEEEDNDQDMALTSNIESILDVVKATPIREELLRWHYRSRDARLIAFSNSNIYEDALTAFPGINRDSPIIHHLVSAEPLPGRRHTSHPDEVGKVVDLILEHAREHPDESLGVIAFGSDHADNVDNALRSRLRDAADGHLDAFFAEDVQERFFVKNIERVQGDERDVIILSVGYHKAADGSLPYRFGPLNQQGGERRLNVAITRARSRLHLFSSFSHHDMEPGRSTARGVELLRQYLEFADSGGTHLEGEHGEIPLNAFELDVMHRLRDRGIPLIPQYGVAGYRIDFACQHPDYPGSMVLAIEADGASYHSGHTARERDRLRQENLEDKGWRFHRIWSTAWFRNRESEVEKAVRAWRDACADFDVDRVSLTPSLENKSKPSEPDIPEQSAVSPRGPAPGIYPGLPITEYCHEELVALARWIYSDTLLRTDDDIHKEMRSHLGFKRGGSRINPAIQRAVDEAKRGS